MSTNQGTEFPRIAQNPHLMRMDNLANIDGVVGSDFDPREINSEVKKFLEAPIIPDSNDHDLRWTEGYINPDPLRSNLPNGYWDLEDGETLEVKLVENLDSNPEVYEGKLRVVEELPPGVTPDVKFHDRVNSSASPQEVYDHGAIVLSGYPEDMEIDKPLSYNFKVSNRKDREQYDDLGEKFREVFGNIDYQSAKAMRALGMGYDEFEDGRLF